MTCEMVPGVQPSGKWRAMKLQHTSGVLNPNESSVDTSQRGLESMGLSKPPTAGTEVGGPATTGGGTATLSSDATTGAPSRGRTCSFSAATCSSEPSSSPDEATNSRWPSWTTHQSMSARTRRLLVSEPDDLRGWFPPTLVWWAGALEEGFL